MCMERTLDIDVLTVKHHEAEVKNIVNANSILDFLIAQQSQNHACYLMAHRPLSKKVSTIT